MKANPLLLWGKRSRYRRAIGSSVFNFFEKLFSRWILISVIEGRYESLHWTKSSSMRVSMELKDYLISLAIALKHERLFERFNEPAYWFWAIYAPLTDMELPGSLSAYDDEIDPVTHYIERFPRYSHGNRSLGKVLQVIITQHPIYTEQFPVFDKKHGLGALIFEEPWKDGESEIYSVLYFPLMENILRKVYELRKNAQLNNEKDPIDQKFIQIHNGLKRALLTENSLVPDAIQLFLHGSRIASLLLADVSWNTIDDLLTM